MEATALEREIANLEAKLLYDLKCEQEALERDVARSSLIEFTKYTKPDFEENWHHTLIAEAIDEYLFEEGLDYDGVIFEAPPRHGKSELISRRLPAFALGHFPDWQVLSGSYSADLAKSMNRDLQEIMETESYELLFPLTRLPTDKDKEIRTQTEFEIVGRRGLFRCAGVGGGFTGRGGNLAIIDDPIKNREEANSPTYRERVYRWYTSSFFTRLEDPRKIIVMMTRWHEDDLIARILKKAKENGHAFRWKVVKLPAIADTGTRTRGDNRGIGEALWPSKFPIARLYQIKAELTAEDWEGLFQQRPSSPEGNIIKREYWKRYKTLPEKFDEIIQSWDLRFTKNTEAGDFVVGHVWGRVGSQKYLIDRVKGRWGFIDTLKEFRSLSANYPEAYAKLVEKKANGEALEDALSEAIPGIILVNPKGDKVSRVNAILPTIEAGNCYLPEDSAAPWVDEFINECADFPKAAHDDEVDAMSQALLRFKENEIDFSDMEALATL